MRSSEAAKRVAVWAGLILAAGIALSLSPAEARTFISLGVGVPLGPPAYYPPPPVYYPPPPAVAYAAPAPTVQPVPPAPATHQECREYQSKTTIDGRPQPTYGTACRQPDGTWRIVN